MQVGIMFSGARIDNMIIGGPAYNSRMLDRGDVVCRIDRAAVNVEDLQSALSGCDIPGSSVVLTVQKTSGRIMDVVLKRMAISVIADRCKMFELFAACKVLLLHPYPQAPSLDYFLRGL